MNQELGRRKRFTGQEARGLSDIELLRLAAKAVELDEEYQQQDSWKPLLDGGQALSLATKLHMHLGLESCVANAWSTSSLRNFQTVIFDHWGTVAAVRRAIVLCAAQTMIEKGEAYERP